MTNQNRKQKNDRNPRRQESFMEELVEEVIPVANWVGGGGTLTEDEQIQRKKDNE